jgi:A/G-specific adenine glycosylase
MAKKEFGKAAELRIRPEQVRTALLAWYERSRRDLPWRRTSDPYAIWVSEIMLQQTRVAVVVERYNAFMARFATIAALAGASEQEVLALWSGLGYYRRARMLHKAAQLIAAERRGILPQTATELRSLPGIGEYTSAAIASIAHGERIAVVDGNVERVLCRLAGWDAHDSKESAGLRTQIEKLAARLVDPERPGDFNQAMMELGATVCLPRNPQCLICPLKENCRTRGEHKTAPRPQAVQRKAAFALCLRARQNGREGLEGREGRLKADPMGPDREILLEQRPASQSVMPELWELPALRDPEAGSAAPLITVRHAIMNVNYRVSIRSVSEDELDAMTAAIGERRWVALRDAAAMALTGLARKVLERSDLIASRAPEPAPARASATP